MYNKARSGNLPNFTGVSSPYEAPEQPHLRIDTQNVGLDAGVDQLIALINGPH
jgi:adenylylsulfate kinase-like enzyme